MKKWTVVVEIHDDTNLSEKRQIEQLVEGIFCATLPVSMSFQIFEVTEAPYGPQGVVLSDVTPGRAGRIQTATQPRCICHGICKPRTCPVHGGVA